MNGGCYLCSLGCGEVERGCLAGPERDIARLASKKAVTGDARRRGWIGCRLHINVEGEPYALRLRLGLWDVRMGRQIIRTVANIYDIETGCLPGTKVDEAKI